MTDDAGGILSDDVEGSKHAVASLLAQRVDEGLLGVVVRRAVVVVVVLARLVLVRLACNARDAEQQVPNELHRAGQGSVRRQESRDTHLCRILQLSSKRPRSSSGSKRSMALVLCCATIMRPAFIDASRT